MPVRSENRANKTAGPEEANRSVGTQDNTDAGYSEMETDPAQDYFVLPICSSYTSIVKSSEAKNEVDHKDQAFLEELERLKRQENKANDAAEALRKEFSQDAEDLLLQAGAARATSTNTVNTVRTPVSTASSSSGPSYPDLTNYDDQDDSQILAFEDIYNNLNDGIVTNASYDDEGAIALCEEAIGLNWITIIEKDERGVMVRNKARLVAQGYRQEERIDYDEEVYVSQPPGFVDPKFPKKDWIQNSNQIDRPLFIKKDKNDIMLVQVYVDDIIFGSTKRSWCDEFEALMKSRFQMSSIGELTFFLGLQTASTPIETQKPLTKDEEAADVDVHLYRSMIGSLMYLTASRPDIMFAVCACSRVSSFDLEAYSDSDYARANLDRKSTTGGCQFLGRRLISWQCKKQTIVATSTTEAEYVVAANCCGQVLWIQNQMLDYGFNFMNTKIYIDNESTICMVKNPVFHSKTKHIKIRHHFIRDAYEKKLIYVLKIHTDDNLADLLTKAFDVSSTAWLGWCCSKVFINGVDAWTGSKMQCGLDLRGTNGSEGDQIQPSHDSNILGGPTSNRAKGSMTLEELYVLCTNLSNKVLALEASKNAQAA
ncbi:putative ribonuclease H-like domain-containing protein [Tanacetum coccineum]